MKSSAHTVNVLNLLFVTLFLTLFILFALFIGYVYALQYNASLYIPGFSEPANTLVGFIWKTPFSTPTPTKNPESVLYGLPKPAPEFVGVTKWLDDRPASIGQYAGRKIVVLIFGRLYCTYCLNVYTYLTEYQRNYGSDYIQVIALQSPKYDGEKVWADVEKEIRERDVNFPVGLDLEKKTSALYNVDMVPTVFVIDKQGMIRYSHTGEGGFAETEKAIQEIIRMEYPDYQ